MKRIASKSYLKNVFSGYEVLPNIDEEKHPKRQGLEGPFRLKSGKVVYYDSKEGKYYDASTDMYLSEEEYAGHQESRKNPHA